MTMLARQMIGTATYWAPTGAYSTYGDPVFAAPVLLDPSTSTGVRFETKSVKFLNTKGDEDLGHSIVYSVATTFAIGGYLYPGTSVASDPETVNGAFRILHVDSSQNLRGDTTLNKAIL